MRTKLKYCMFAFALFFIISLSFNYSVKASYVEKLKMEKYYNNYSSYLSGTVGIKKYKLIIKENDKVIHNKLHTSRKFSVKIGKRDRSTKFEILVKKKTRVKVKKKKKNKKVKYVYKYKYTDYARKGRFLGSDKWWEYKYRYNNCDNMDWPIKNFKEADPEICVYVKPSYYMNLIVYGNSGKKEYFKNIKNAQTLYLKFTEGSIAYVTYTVFSNSGKKIATGSVNALDRQFVDWSDNNIESLSKQIKKAKKLNPKLYKDYLFDINNNLFVLENNIGNNLSLELKSNMSYQTYNEGIIVNPFVCDISWEYDAEKNDNFKETIILCNVDSLKNKANDILSECNIKEDMSDQEKAFKLGYYLVNNVSIVSDSNKKFISNALMDKKANEVAITKAYAFLCRYVDIDCDYVSSYLPEKHSYNRIKLGNYYYNVDLKQAYKNKNSILITNAFFFGNNTIDKNYIKYIEPLYTVNWYTKTHKVDYVSYQERCKKLNLSYLEPTELYNSCIK